MNNEWNGSQGYIALRKETVRGVPDPAATPVYVPYYNENISTDLHLMSDQPAVGVNWRTFQALAGTRSHSGSLSTICEPNTMAHFANMVFKQKSKSTASGVTTYTYDNTVFDRPDSYTMDVSKGPQVIRYTGVELSKLGFGWDGEKMVLNSDVAALKAINVREIASISTTTLVLDQTYDQDATAGFMAGDLVAVVKKDGTRLNTTVTSITDTKTIVLAASAATYAAGDVLVLRPATPMLSVLTPFTWPRTRFYFADNLTALNALAKTDHTPMDSGTEIGLMREFEDKEGAKRSGSYDPASFPRVAPAADFKGKKIFDNANDLKNWNAHRPNCAMMRCWTDNTDQYEMRITFPSVYTSALPIPQEPDKTTYQEPEFLVGYSQTAGYAFKLEVLNAITTA